ncbi:MAG: pyridoxamine 5'-phosphate oxidase [Actinobacteria bacterium]|nr:MAG: pyridoxamine 5'-phosphate oxidase [Actinomycetota bacterium]
MDPAALRRQYEGPPFDVGDLAPTWLEQFQRWLDDAVAATVPEPNAMVVATADPSGAPSARTVLLRGVDERGFAFYTNLESRKGLQALANPRASAVFTWLGLQRQVVVTGAVERVSDEEADVYWASRPVASRISAAASPQSQVVPSREALDETWAKVAEQGDDVARPPHWSGLRIVPETVEFWQGRRDRFHDRLRFRRQGEDWVVERLAP